jgi:hypothetical protein
VLQVPSVHAPEVHDSEAFASEQTAPHAPQFVSVVSGDSQPSAALPLQSPKPALQACSAQDPLKQVAVACGKAHAVPHAPQFVTLLLRLVSQPFAGFASQSPKPAVHATWHAPAEQLGAPFEALQTRPHDPQLFGSVAVDTSQPVAYERSQFACAPSQLATPQVVPRHAGVPFCTVHTVPQPPQFAVLFVVAVSQPLLTLASQLPNPAAHVMPQTPDEQKASPFVELQARAQPPQFFALVSVFVSQPFAALPSQSANGGTHDAISHVPVVQVVLAFGRTHSCPHAPQLSGVERSASHPS